MVRRGAAVVISLALIGAAGGASAQRTGDESPGQNVHQSQQYEQLLCSNPAFRKKRIDQECGPLQGSQFYDNCVASFQCNAQHPTSQQAPPSETVR